MNSSALKKKFFVVYTFVLLLLYGCTVTEHEPMKQHTNTSTKIPTSAVQLKTTSAVQLKTATHTPSPTNTQTQSPTNTDTILTEVSFESLEMQPVSAQFIAIRQNCQQPLGSSIENIPQDCFHTGLLQGDFLNFGRLSLYHSLRITYAFVDGNEVPKDFLDNVHLAVFKFVQNGNYQAEATLHETLLHECDQNPTIVFTDLNLDYLQKTGYLAFYLVLRNNDGYIYKADQILFYEPHATTLTATSAPTSLPTQTPTPPSVPRQSPTTTAIPTQTPTSTNTTMPTTIPTVTNTPTWDWG